MSCSEKDSDTLMLSKEVPDSSSTDESSYSGSSTGGGMINLKKGPWTTAEDALLISYVQKHGEGNWNVVQKHSGLLRCGKSCRLRWSNHLRPHLKKGAFSPEEKQMIFQMHSKLGNKWARMAARLPGRTDNGIKNYWNTFVKRRLRAGLPIHPRKAKLQTSNDNQLIQNTSEFCSGNQQNIGVSPGTMNGMLEFRFLPPKANPGPRTYRPPFADIPVTGMPIHGLRNYSSSFLNPGTDHVRQTWESGTSFPGCNASNTSTIPAYEEPPHMNSETIYLNPGLGLPHEPDPESKNRASFICSTPSNQAFSNDNLSSSRLLPGAVKMELPSLQHTEADYIDWNTSSLFALSYDAVDSYIQTPESFSEQSNCASPRNKGLLEDLVQESQAISTGKKQSFKKSPDHAVTTETITTKTDSSTVKCEDVRDPTSPFCLSAVSLFNECLEATMLSAKQDQHAPNLLQFLRPDVLLGSGWFVGNSGSAVDSISIILEEDLRDQRVAVSGEISSMASYPWSKMPGVCHMSENS